MNWYNKNKNRYHPVIVASYMHTAFEAIHPFIDVSEIIPPNEIRGLETPSTTRRGVISEHVKNRPMRGGVQNYMPPSKRAVFNGNGRVGRLLLNFILIKNKFPPINIKNQRKMAYYKALEKAQIEGDLKTFVDLIAYYIKISRML